MKYPAYSRECFSDPDRNPAEMPLPYVRPQRILRIFGWVALCHLLLLVIPVLWNLWNVRKPVHKGRYVLRVPLVESLPNQHKEMSRHPSPDRPKPIGTPDLGKPEPQPKAKPVSKPKPQPQSKPKVKPQTQPKPNPKAKAIPKPKPKQEQKWKALTTEEILKGQSHKVVKKTTKTTRPRQQSTSNSQEQSERAALAKRLRSMTGTAGGTGAPGGGGGPMGKLAESEVEIYYVNVESFLKRRWVQPRISGQKPVVIILFKIDASGRILYARIKTKSGNRAMDDSIENLLRNLKALPKPPTAMEFEAEMKID